MTKGSKPFLKLGRLDGGDKREVKLSNVILDPLTGEDFRLYIEAYTASYGGDAPKPEILGAAIIREFLESDRAFNAYKREKRGKSPEAKPETQESQD